MNLYITQGIYNIVVKQEFEQIYVFRGMIVEFMSGAQTQLWAIVSFFCMWLLDNVLIMFRRFIRWNFNLSNLNHLKVSNVLMMIQEFKHGPSPSHPYPVLWPQFGRVLDIHYTIKYSLYILIYMSNMLKLEFEILLKYILCCKSQFAWVSKLCLSPRSLFIHGFYQFNQGHLRSTSGLVLKQAFEQNQNLWDWWLYIDFNIYIQLLLKCYFEHLFLKIYILK